MVPENIEMSECSIKNSHSNDLYLLKQKIKHKKSILVGALEEKGILILSEQTLVSVIKEEEAPSEIVEKLPKAKLKKKMELIRFSGLIPLDPDHEIIVYGPKRTRMFEIQRVRKEYHFTRTSREEAITLIYKAYEKQPCWTLKDLSLTIQQPMVLAFISL
eukprot:TRINITY_DN2513_c0_g1_i2.p1 TRINITY_DN2513_c0_g1~~TRINITY_DN2513_c0_g1_i2.p1  ORF type:complete len:160 (-),score=19.84 TRINITY_DN2513_c0_g1_i2:136-615(-)